MPSQRGRWTVAVGKRLAYGYEITAYAPKQPTATPIKYETDLLITQALNADTWIPRIVIEAKINSVSTHDAITYSQKAFTHKSVHPYLRYGIVLGNRRSHPLPGRLFRHGGHFDFMMSFVRFQPSVAEVRRLQSLIKDELGASVAMQHIIYESRKRARDRFTLLQRKLVLG